MSAKNEVVVECDGCPERALTTMTKFAGGRPRLPGTWGSCGVSEKRPGHPAYWCRTCYESGRFNRVLLNRKRESRRQSAEGRT